MKNENWPETAGHTFAQDITSLDNYLFKLYRLSKNSRRVQWNMRGAIFMPLYDLLRNFNITLANHQNNISEHIMFIRGYKLAYPRLPRHSVILDTSPMHISEVITELKSLSDNYASFAIVLKESISTFSDKHCIQIIKQLSDDLERYSRLIIANI